jgi:hypothetical protein
LASGSARNSAEGLPAVTADLWIEAAALAALRQPRQGAAILRRGLEQAGAMM